jgi:hypothetical protein
MDYLIKNRPVHQLAGAHKRGALYSARAPCEKPTEGRVLARLGWAGEIEASVSAALQLYS